MYISQCWTIIIHPGISISSCVFVSSFSPGLGGEEVRSYWTSSIFPFKRNKNKVDYSERGAENIDPLLIRDWTRLPVCFENKYECNIL